MKEEYKNSPAIARQNHRILYVLFWVIFLGRLLFPLQMNPMDFLITDPGRHFQSGKSLFSYNTLSGIDAKFYHLYLYIINIVTQGNHIAIAISAGILCAGMQWVWYKATREFLPKKSSLIFAIIIGLSPSLLFIFGLFMSETLLLVLLGLGIWMALRAYRKKTLLSFTVAVLILLLATQTRVFVLPLAIFCVVGLVFLLDKKIKRIFIALTITSMVCAPAIFYGYKTLNVFAPFGYPMVNIIYRKSNMTGIKISILDKQEYFNFGSPSFFNTQPFEPFMHYKTARKYGQLVRSVDTRNGSDDWWKIYDSLPYSSENFIMDLKDNFVFYFFGPSWPDDNYRVNLYVPWQAYVTAHKYWRFIWAPMLLIIILYSPLLTISHKERFILFITFGLTFLAIMQQSAIMEGRYRKPMEPLYILSLIIVLRHFFTHAWAILLPRHQEQDHQDCARPEDEHENVAQTANHPHHYSLSDDSQNQPPPAG
jgi:hypothetical protein